MTKQAIIDKTVKAINQLPEEKAEEISNFAEFIIKRHEEQLITKGISHLTSSGKAFDFLKEEEDLYTEGDIKEAYNG